MDHYISVFRLGNSGNFKVRPAVVNVGPNDQVFMTLFGKNGTAKFETTAQPLNNLGAVDLTPNIVTAMRGKGQGPHSYQVVVDDFGLAEAESDPVLVIW